MIRTSQTTKTIWPIILSIQSQIRPVYKDAANTHHRSRYASLSSILAMLKPILTAENVVLTQYVDDNDGSPHMHSRVTHAETGEYVDVYVPIDYMRTAEFVTANPSGKSHNAMQQIGSALTYGRRYSLSALFALDVSDEEDDDGNAGFIGGEAIEKPKRGEAAGSKPQTDKRKPTGAEALKAMASEKSAVDIVSAYRNTTDISALRAIARDYLAKGRHDVVALLKQRVAEINEEREPGEDDE